MRHFAILFTVAFGFFFGFAPAGWPQIGQPRMAQQESVPRLLQVTGTLKDATMRSLPGAASVTFAIYSEQDGGTALWSETQNVLADAIGHFNVLLGAATSAGVPAELFGTGQSRWLGVTIARQPEMSRVLLASVPYALKAGDAETLGGLPASAYVTTQSLTAKASGSTMILATPEVSTPPRNSSDAAAIPQATPSGSGTTNYLPKWTSSSALGNSVLFQSGSNIGIGTTTPTETLDVNGNSIFRGSFQLPPGHDATTSAGYESHSFQFQASSYNSSTKASTTQAFGFRAEPLNNNTANPSAKLDLFFIPNGGSMFIDTGLSFANNGIVTFPTGQTFDGTSVTLTGDLNASGVTVFTSDVHGIYSSTSSSIGEGVTGVSTGSDGEGVLASGATGIYAIGTTLAGDFIGDVYVGGTLSKAGGSFKIDHPTDPQNKYLSHSFVESPDMMNIYNGNVVTDISGYAQITMPDWFDALNSDFRYQLTVLGTQFAQAIVTSKMAANHFTIRTDKPGIEVSWMVTGIRQDAWANAHRIYVEEEKADKDKGYFLHPELFGHAGEPGIMSKEHQRDHQFANHDSKSKPTIAD